MLFAFQFTPLREGRRFKSSGYIDSDIFQFTPLREGRHSIYDDPYFDYQISIHAPPRGATHPRCSTSSQILLFQFTPLREGRPALRDNRAVAGNFNSRPSARGDITADYNPIENYISIHAPPRGATACERLYLWQEIFQFTPLREGRRLRLQRFTKSVYFNSRPSARGDYLYYPPFGVIQLISIHAPPRGATSIVIILSLT